MAARELNALIEEDGEEEDGDLIYSRLVANIVHVHNLLQRTIRDVPALDDGIPGKQHVPLHISDFIFKF